MNAPSLSVIIPVFNESGWLQSTIDQLLAARFNLDLEIIVVDDASTDNGCDFLLEYECLFPAVKFTVHTTKGLGNARARDFGARTARGEILFFIDAHMEIPPLFLNNLLQRFVRFPEINILGPRIYDSSTSTISENASYLYACADPFWVQPCWIPHEVGRNELMEVPFLCACALSIRRATYFKLHGFPEFAVGWFDEGLYFSTIAQLAGEKVYQDFSLSIGHFFKDISICTEEELLRRRWSLTNGLCACFLLYDSKRRIEWAMRKMQEQATELFHSAYQEFILKTKKLTSKKRTIKRRRSFNDFIDRFSAYRSVVQTFRLR